MLCLSIFISHIVQTERYADFRLLASDLALYPTQFRQNEVRRELLQQYFDAFISHIVQTEPSVLAYIQPKYFTLYPTQFRQNSFHDYTPLQVFLLYIPHSSDRTDKEHNIIIICEKSFISHIVQTEPVKIYNTMLNENL